MNHKKKQNQYNVIIDKIEKTRKKNNRNWMDLLRLAFNENPTKAKVIVRSIFTEDKRISNLVDKLTKK